MGTVEACCTGVDEQTKRKKTAVEYKRQRQHTVDEGHSASASKRTLTHRCARPHCAVIRRPDWQAVVAPRSERGRAVAAVPSTLLVEVLCERRKTKNRRAKGTTSQCLFCQPRARGSVRGALTLKSQTSLAYNVKLPGSVRSWHGAVVT